MNFTMTRGKDFYEFFEFKNSQGKPIAMPSGKFRVVLERGGFAKEYTVLNGGLQRLRNRVNWRIPASDTADFEFSTMYYTLYLEDRELIRGVIKVQ